MQINAFIWNVTHGENFLNVWLFKNLSLLRWKIYRVYWCFLHPARMRLRGLTGILVTSSCMTGDPKTWWFTTTSTISVTGNLQAGNVAVSSLGLGVPELSWLLEFSHMKAQLREDPLPGQPLWCAGRLLPLPPELREAVSRYGCWLPKVTDPTQSPRGQPRRKQNLGGLISEWVTCHEFSCVPFISSQPWMESALKGISRQDHQGPHREISAHFLQLQMI